MIPSKEEMLPYRKQVLVKILLYIASLYVDGDEKKKQFAEFSALVTRGY